MGARDIKRYCSVKDDAEKLLETAINKLGLSTRAYSRVLKVGRTIPIWPERRTSKLRTLPRRFSIGAWIGECDYRSVGYDLRSKSTGPAFSWVDSVSPDLSIVATLAQAVGSELDVR